MSLPRVLQGYEIQDHLGSGGMGEIYRALEQRTGRLVALKVEGDRAGQDPSGCFRERFLREARILQGLHHENLPEFYGVGEAPDGRMFIAMELLIGRPLSLFAGADLDSLLPLFIQSARALEGAADAGIVHRDVSPDNFFVVEVGGRSIVKLIDFGIARDNEAVADGLTRAGAFLGKADFCSPEQTGLLGQGRPLDWRTDLYSLGLTMYFLIVGKTLTEGLTLMEQLNAKLREVPRLALHRIPNPRIRKLLSRMLKREPSERPESFGIVVAELLRVQSEIAVSKADFLEETVRKRRRKIPPKHGNPAREATVSVSAQGGLRGMLPASVGALRSAASRFLSRLRSEKYSPRLLISGDGENREVTLPGCSETKIHQEFVLGRACENSSPGIRLSSRTVSALHARLTCEGEGYYLENLSKTNPTFVNGRAIGDGEKRLLRDGDRIDLGEVSVSFRA